MVSTSTATATTCRRYLRKCFIPYYFLRNLCSEWGNNGIPFLQIAKENVPRHQLTRLRNWACTIMGSRITGTSRLLTHTLNSRLLGFNHVTGAFGDWCIPETGDDRFQKCEVTKLEQEISSQSVTIARSGLIWSISSLSASADQWSVVIYLGCTFLAQS